MPVWQAYLRLVPEERHRSKERHRNHSSYCQSDSCDRRRHNTAAAARRSSRRIGCHPDWRFRSSGTPCSPSSSEQEVSLDECLDEGQYHHACPNTCRDRFTHFGWFASMYFRRFGELPSATHAKSLGSS